MDSPDEMSREVLKTTAQDLMRRELEAADRRRREKDSPGPSMDLTIQVAMACGLRPGEVIRHSGLSHQGVINARKDRSPGRLRNANRVQLQSMFLAIIAANGGVASFPAVAADHLHLSPADAEDLHATLRLPDLRKRKLIAISRQGGIEAITLLPSALDALSDREREAAWVTRDSHNFYLVVDREEAPAIGDAAFRVMGAEDFALIYPEVTLGTEGEPELAFRIAGHMTQREARRSAEGLWAEIRSQAKLDPTPAFVIFYYPSGEAIAAG